MIYENDTMKTRIFESNMCVFDQKAKFSPKDKISSTPISKRQTSKTKRLFPNTIQYRSSCQITMKMTENILIQGM